MSICPCNSKNNYSHCCAPYLEEQQLPITPEALMRSRYTAYCLGEIAYIKKTMRGKPLLGFDEDDALAWAKRVTWLGLTIINTKTENPNLGYVEFIARFIDGDQLKSIHEVSEFQHFDDKWFYTDGSHPSTNKLDQNQKIGRNSPCPCGKPSKFKNCHGKTKR